MAGSIALALLLQGIAGYTVTYAEKINENDGTSGLPVTAGTDFHVYADNTATDTIYYGVYSNGSGAVTDITLTGQQSVVYDTSHNFIGQQLKGEAYGIYTEAGATVNWATENGDEGLILSSSGNEALAYGIYTAGSGSAANIGSEESQNLQITVSAANIEKNEAGDAAVLSAASAAKAIGISGEAQAQNKIYAGSITADVTMSRQNNYTADTTVLAAKQTLDAAADAYVQVVENYADYATAEEYLGAMNVAQAALDAAVAAYEEVAAQALAAGVYGDSGATNEVRLSGDISAAFTADFSAITTIAAGANNTDGQVAVALPGTAIGIYGDNGAVNKVSAVNIKSNADVSIYTIDTNSSAVGVASAQSITVAAPVTAIGVYGDNGAANEVEAESIEVVYAVKPSGVSASNYGSGQLTQEVNLTAPVKAFGIYGANEAVNRVTVGTISVDNTETYDTTIGIGGYAYADEGSVVQNVTIALPAYIAGVRGEQQAVNIIDAGTIEVMNSKLGSIYDGVNGNVVNTVNAALPQEVAGISGDGGAQNIITAEAISVNNSVKASIGDNNSSGSESNLIVAMPVNTYGVYGNGGAVNVIAAGSITAVGAADVSIQDNINGNVKQNFEIMMPFAVTGVYGSNGATNNITATDITAEVTFQSSSNMISGEGESGYLQIAAEVPLTAMGVYGGSGSVTNLVTDSIRATANIGQVNLFAAENTNSDFEEEIALTYPVAVYGVYGSGGAVINLHSQEQGGTVVLEVGTNQYTEEEGVDVDASTYGLYADAATIILFDNVSVEGVEVSGYRVASPITYLRDATVSFAGYNDYYDEYVYDFATGASGADVSGSGAFHTYTSADGKLELHGSNTFRVNTDLAGGNADKLSFQTISAKSTAGTNYVEVAADVSFTGEEDTLHLEGHAVVLAITETDKSAEEDSGLATTAGSQNAAGLVINNDGSAELNFVGKTSTLDNPLERYTSTPTVVSEATDTGRNVVITAIDFAKEGPSEGLLTVGDAQLAMRNLGRVENSTLMQRMGDLRRHNEQEEGGVWARLTKGEMRLAGNYDRKFTQSYNQFQLGYDHRSEYNGGKLYSGAAVSHIFGDVDYLKGTGEAKSTTLAFYRTWLGDKGHYYDLVARAGRLDNKFALVDLSDNSINGNYNTYHYGVSAEYGYRKPLAKGYFLEPQVQLSLDHIQGVDYRLSNDVEIRQSGINSALLRFGILAGREFGGGNAYLKASVLKDVAGSGTVTGYYNGSSMAVETVGNKAWYEVGLGTNAKLSKTNNFYLDVTKSFGGNVRQKWQFNTGLSWSF